MSLALNDRAREVAEEMDRRVPPFQFKTDLAKIDSILTSPDVDLLAALLRASLLIDRAKTLSALGRSQDAVDEWVEVTRRYDDDPDAHVRHRGDLARMHCADCLMTSLARIDQGAELSRELLGRFENNPSDPYLPYKGMMLMDLAHILFAVGQTDDVRSIATSVYKRLEPGDDISRAVAAEALFYLIHAVARDGDAEDAASEAEALLHTGQPGLQGLDRLADRFAGPGHDNPVWLFQIDQYRAMILMHLDRLTEAQALWKELEQRADRLKLPQDLRAQQRQLGQDLARAD